MTDADEAIRLDHLSFTYADHFEPALRDVSLRVRRGEMVVVMGATGAGKTTLAKCLNRTVPAFQPGTLSGEIVILGRRLHREGVADLAGTVGLVSQDFEAQLFATNVLQEVVFGMEQLGVPVAEIGRRVPAVLQLVGLSGFEQRDPNTLSGGEKQRLAIAATLALQPSILVFDEPTTDLDPVGKLEIFDVLAAMRREGYTLVVIEHETAAAEKADRLILMRHGAIGADGPALDLLSNPDLLRDHGVRPPDLGRIAKSLDLDPVPTSIEQAGDAMRSRGMHLRPDATHDGSLTASAQPLLPQPLVQVEDVEFGYDAARVALRNVSLSLYEGDFVALIGQNGSGKTTLAKHLNGLLRPSRGRVLLRGRDVRLLPLNRVAGDVGYVFQNPDHQIFAATVGDEIAFGPRNFGLLSREVDERVQGAIEAVGLQGLDEEDPFLLGKGHRQRLAVASILALRPSLLVLDEPTTGLDYAEQLHMMDLLARLHRGGMAILIITHSPWVVAEYARRGVLMSGGAVIFDGPLRRLFAQEKLLARAHFVAPEVTRLGQSFGFTPLSVDELIEAVGRGQQAEGTTTGNQKRETRN